MSRTMKWTTKIWT